MAATSSESKGKSLFSNLHIMSDKKKQEIKNAIQRGDLAYFASADLQDIKHFYYQGKNVLHLAVYTRNLELVELLCQKYPEFINRRSYYREVPLDLTLFRKKETQLPLDLDTDVPHMELLTEWVIYYRQGYRRWNARYWETNPTLVEDFFKKIDQPATSMITIDNIRQSLENLNLVIDADIPMMELLISYDADPHLYNQYVASIYGCLSALKFLAQQHSVSLFACTPLPHFDLLKVAEFYGHTELAMFIDEHLRQSPEIFAKRNFIHDHLFIEHSERVKAFVADRSAIAPSLPALQNLQELFGSHIMLGAHRHHQLPKRFLIDNMAALKEAGFNMLFLEFFYYDNDHAMLDEYFNSTDPTVSEKFKDRLSTILRFRIACPSEVFFQQLVDDYIELFNSAKTHGIRIIGLELNHVSLFLSGTYASTQYDTRVPYFNYQATQIIQQEANNDPSGKWIAMVSLAHLHDHATFNEQPVPGIADVTGSRVIITQDNQKKQALYANYTLATTPYSQFETPEYYPCDVFHCDKPTSPLVLKSPTLPLTMASPAGSSTQVRTRALPRNTSANELGRFSFMCSTPWSRDRSTLEKETPEESSSARFNCSIS